MDHKWSKRDQKSMEIAMDDTILSLDFESDWYRWSNSDGLESDLSKILFGSPNCLSLTWLTCTFGISSE